MKRQLMESAAAFFVSFAGVAEAAVTGTIPGDKACLGCDGFFLEAKLY